MKKLIIALSFVLCFSAVAAAQQAGSLTGLGAYKIDSFYLGMTFNDFKAEAEKLGGNYIMTSDYYRGREVQMTLKDSKYTLFFAPSNTDPTANQAVPAAKDKAYLISKSQNVTELVDETDLLGQMQKKYGPTAATCNTFYGLDSQSNWYYWGAISPEVDCAKYACLSSDPVILLNVLLIKSSTFIKETSRITLTMQDCSIQKTQDTYFDRNDPVELEILDSISK